MSLFQCAYLYRDFTQWEGFVEFSLTLDIFLMQDGVTAMYFAAKNKYPGLVELLLAHGADINKVQHCVMYRCIQCSSTSETNMWIASSFLEVM